MAESLHGLDKVRYVWNLVDQFWHTNHRKRHWDELCIAKLEEGKIAPSREGTLAYIPKRQMKRVQRPGKTARDATLEIGVLDFGTGMMSTDCHCRDENELFEAPSVVLDGI
jgi:hypothetical protein